MSCLYAGRTHSVAPHWRPPCISAYITSDRCHLNGLKAYATVNPRSPPLSAKATCPPAGARAARGDILMDIADNRIVARGLSMPHSPRWYRNQLWILESGAGRFGTLNLKTGRQDVVAELPGFTHGLDFVGDYAFIGLSQVRETAVFQRTATHRAGGGAPLRRLGRGHCPPSDRRLRHLHRRGAGNFSRCRRCRIASRPMLELNNPLLRVLHVARRGVQERRAC
ncbi:MAG: DUF4915 domain-containing protein [Candidatus Competibacteraceae bacterium]